MEPLVARATSEYDNSREEEKELRLCPWRAIAKQVPLVWMKRTEDSLPGNQTLGVFRLFL